MQTYYVNDGVKGHESYGMYYLESVLADADAVAYGTARPRKMTGLCIGSVMLAFRTGASSPL